MSATGEHTVLESCLNRNSLGKSAEFRWRNGHGQTHARLTRLQEVYHHDPQSKSRTFKLVSIVLIQVPLVYHELLVKAAQEGRRTGPQWSEMTAKMQRESEARIFFVRRCSHIQSQTQLINHLGRRHFS